MHRYDKKSSLIWFIFSLCIIGGASAYPFGVLSRPGPGFLPTVCGVIMAGLSLVVFFQAFGGDQKGKDEGKSFFTARWPRLVAALVILLAYGFLVEPVGYLAATFIFILLALKVVEPSRWRTALLEAVLATVLSYAVFELWLNVQLPKGFWPRLFS
ncbi:MAG: tripartite tricarboxylate transporter TctB family protein [Deltaproteobacteria bacterium]|nr:tripartite tricarboxylate transporter TctB family protein [Deltaproteobacteria bacterium]